MIISLGSAVSRPGVRLIMGDYGVGRVDDCSPDELSRDEVSWNRKVRVFLKWRCKCGQFWITFAYKNLFTHECSIFIFFVLAGARYLQTTSQYESERLKCRNSRKGIKRICLLQRNMYVQTLQFSVYKL